MFYNRRALENHLRSHFDEKRYKCEYCEWTFCSESDLETHLHPYPAQTSYKSGISGKDVCQDSKLSDHLQLHNEENQVKCITCNKTFANLCELHKHINVSEVCQKVYENLYTHKAKRIEVLSNPSSAEGLSCAETLPRPESPFPRCPSTAQQTSEVAVSSPVLGEISGLSPGSEAGKLSGITRTAADSENLTYSRPREHHVPRHTKDSSQYEDRSQDTTGISIPQNLNVAGYSSRPQAQTHYGIGSETNPGSTLWHRINNETSTLSLPASQHEEELHHGQGTHSDPSFLFGNLTSTTTSEKSSLVEPQTPFLPQNSFAHNIPYEQESRTVPGSSGTFETRSSFRDLDVDDTQPCDVTISERGTQFVPTCSGTFFGNQTSAGLRTQSAPPIPSGTVVDTRLGPHSGPKPPNEHLEHFVRELYTDPGVFSAFKTYLEGLQDETQFPLGASGFPG